MTSITRHRVPQIRSFERENGMFQHFSVSKLDTLKNTVLLDQSTSIENVFLQLPVVSKHVNFCWYSLQSRGLYLFLPENHAFNMCMSCRII